MLLEPAKAFVRLIAQLPVWLRPGVAIALPFCVLRLVFVRPGIVGVYRSASRGVAYVVDGVIGMVLLPEYVLTTSRRRRGLEPGTGALLMGNLADPILAGTRGILDKSRASNGRLILRSLPWKSAVVILAVCAGGWLVMDKVHTTSPVRHALTLPYHYWRDVEGWANVSPARRAPRVAWYPPVPKVLHAGGRGSHRRVTLSCRASQTCSARVGLKSGRHTLVARTVQVKPHKQRVVSLRLTRRERRSYHHVRLSIRHR